MPTEKLPTLAAEVQVLQARLRAEEKKLALVQEIGRALSSALDLGRLLALIMERITALMDADRSTLYLLSDDGEQLWSKVTQGDEMREIRLRVGEGIAGWVAKSGEIVNIPDAYNDRRFQPAVDLRTGYRTRSILCMPMRNNQGATIGVIQVLNKIGGPFTPEDESLLAALAGQAAVSIENSKLYHSVVGKNLELVQTQQQLEQRSSELNILFEIEAEINAATDLDEMLERLLARAMNVIAAEAGSIVLRDRGTEELYFRSAAGEAGDAVKRIRLPMGQGIVGWVASRGIPVVVNDPSSDPRHLGEIAERVGYRPRHLICVPLAAEDEVLGAIELLDKRPPSEGFTDADLKLLVLIAGQASRAIHLARAKEERFNQSRLAAIGQMLSSVLHDLKTPMTIVSGYAQLMAQCDDHEQRGQYVDQVLKQFDLMSAMTREVLAYARGESNMLVRKVFLHRFLEEVATQLRQEFVGKDITLELDTVYRGVAFFDEQKMLRVVHNLARNAAQAMPHGGRFRITTRTEGTELVFDFTDTGIGIPAEMEGRMFEPFSTSGKAEGTGLGLAIVKKIVEEHHGRITYMSAPREGTTFTIRMPLEKPVTVETRAVAPTVA